MFLVIAAVLSIFCTPALAISPFGVVVLYNVDSPEGIEIANYYAQVHPQVQLLGLSGVSTAEEVTQDHYLDVIRPQVLAGISDTTEVIVTTKGLPLRIQNTAVNPGSYPGWRGDLFGVPLLDEWWKPYSSLESELTRVDLIDSAEMMGDQAHFMSPPSFPFSTQHQASNPYYGQPFAFERNKEPELEGMRLTSRLDGFTVADVKSSIDRAQLAFRMPTQQLVIVDDDPAAPAALVDRMSELASDVLIPHGQAMVFDQTSANIVDAPLPVQGYVSHGSHAAGEGFVDDLQFNLAAGAVFHTWESFNAYSFTQGNNQYGQSLVGEWLAKGATAGLGHVEEPKASAATVANEDILFDMLLSGHTFVEAAWSATPQLSFVNTVVGDPLMTLRDWVVGDSNLDGVVGLEDLNVVLANWNLFVIDGAISGDNNLDGWVGLEDLSLVLGNWNEGVTAPSLSADVVPEPTTLSAFLVCAIGMGLRRKCRSA